MHKQMDSAAPARYEIRIHEHLDKRRWGDWFDGFKMKHDGNETILTGIVPDSAALYGILSRIRDMGLTLLSVRRLDAE